jgi:hypothetical protein
MNTFGATAIGVVGSGRNALSMKSTLGHSRRRDVPWRDRASRLASQSGHNGHRDHAGRGFPGKTQLGYDGVLLFAPDSSYGRPEDFKALIDAAHARGIMVFLDVVYNHFGPDGNYLPSYSPVFTERHKTPWGAAVNYDAEGSDVIREFIIQNAIYWIDEFHLDGLRLDAVMPSRTTAPRISWTRSRVASGDCRSIALCICYWKMGKTRPPGCIEIRSEIR